MNKKRDKLQEMQRSTRTHTEKTRTAKYRKCEIQDQNDAPDMRTKEATQHEKLSQKGDRSDILNK